MEDAKNTRPVASILLGISAAVLVPLLSILFNKTVLEQTGFQRVIEAMTNAAGYGIKTNGFDVYQFAIGAENIVDIWADPQVFINKLNFSSVLAVYDCTILVIGGYIVAGILFALGIILLKQGKTFSSFLFGGVVGIALYLAITANQNGSALAGMPFTIEGVGLVQYCTNHPTYALNLSGQYDGLLASLTTFTWISVAIAAAGGIMFVYLALKQTAN